MHSGSCLCGAVQFRVSAVLTAIELCHCGQCRKAQGVPFATNIEIPAAAFELVLGADCISEYESSPGKFRAFCRRCGSPIYSRRAALPEVMRLRAGALNEPIPARPVSHAYVDSKCSWWQIDDDLPQFPQGRPRSPTG